MRFPLRLGVLLCDTGCWSKGCRGIVCVLCLLALGGGEVRADDTVPYRLFKAFDGLPNENVTALAQTPNGLLWVGTEAGLAFYDGEEMRRIPIPDSLGTAYISDLHAMPDGSVWVTPSRGEAVKVSFRGLERIVELGDRVVQRILTRRDTLFFVTRTAVWRLPPDREEAIRQPFQYEIDPSAVEDGADVGAGVFNADLGPEGRIWVVDGRLGPGRLRSDGSVSFAGAPSKRPGNFWYNIRFADDGTGLLLQGEQLHRFDARTGALEQELDALGDPTYLSVQGTRAYVTRNQTVLRYDVQERRVHSTLGPAQGLPENIPSRVFRDQEGGLWIGTSEGLLHLMAPEARHVKHVKDSPLLNVGQFLQQGEALWGRTYGTGLVQLQPERRRVNPDGLVGWRQDVRSLDGTLHALGSETRAWYRWDGGTEWEQVRQADGASEGFVGPDGRGYFVREDGLYRYTPTPDSMPSRLVAWPDTQLSRQDVAPAPNGDLIHRSQELILRRRSSDGTVVDTVAVLTPDQNSNLTRMVVDEEGRVWGAYLFGGVLRVDPGTGTQSRTLLDHRMWTVETVRDSLVLAGSRQAGLYLIDARTGAVQRQLTRADGLRSNTVMSAHLSGDSLFVGHDNGLSSLPTTRLFQVPSSPQTLLTGLEIDLEERSPAADSVLAPTERSVGFSYTAPSLAHADQVTYEVRLLPQDTTWNATSRRFTRYTNLDPGTYRFEVRARLGEQPPGAKVAHTVTVPPRFYETGWFQLLAVLGLLGLSVGAYRWRIHQLRRRRKELEAAVQSRTEELAEQKRTTEQQAERLAELDEAKNRFFAHISHEFRTPLSLILSPLQEALRQGRRLGIGQMERMVDNAERLKRLIDQLLDLATLEAGGMTLDRRAGEVTALVERSAEAFRSKAEQKNVRLAVRVPSGRIETRFDPEKVETIVTNLVSNALKFTPEGGAVTVRVGETEEVGEVDVPGDAESVRGAVCIAVSDTGPGIGTEAQEKIFDRFEQADDSLTREHEGTGLGLALTKELVELHGGTIEVESTKGEGTQFTVQLPVVPVVRETEPETTEEKERQGVFTGGIPDSRGDGAPKGGVVALRGGDGGGDQTRSASSDGESSGDDRSANGQSGETDTVLVVEDNDEMRAYLREQLAAHWHVLEAADGEAGWRTVREERPDLVLSDVMMPGTDGIELCDRIKNEEPLRTIPVLLLTARVGDDAVLEGLQVGADDYVEKPFDVTELRQRIENHLASRRHLREQHRKEVRLEALEVVVEEEDVPFAEEVVTVVEERLSNPDFTVSRLAEEMALSRRQLTRRLKDVLGETPGALIRRRRIERAKEYLEGEAETVAEVAYATGFRSPSAFSQTFRDVVGTSPSAYRTEETE